MVDITAEQASVLSVLARRRVRKKGLDTYPELKKKLTGDALSVAQLLYEELPEQEEARESELKPVVEQLTRWASSLPRYRTFNR